MIGTLQHPGGGSDQPFSHTPGSTYRLVPHANCVNVLGPTHPGFLVIPHRKLGAPQPFSVNLYANVSSLSNAPSAPYKNHLLRAMSASTSSC